MMMMIELGCPFKLNLLIKLCYFLVFLNEKYFAKISLFCRHRQHQLRIP